MAVGFAVFSQQLQINSTSEVNSSWCLGFDNTETDSFLTGPGIQTGTPPTGAMTYSGSTCGTKSQVGVTLASVFKQPGDQIEYILTILNEGSLDAAIKSILVDNESVTSDKTITKGNVKYKIEMPLSTSIYANDSTTMRVIASFQNDTDITKSFGGDSASIEVKINAEQDDGNGGFTPAQPPFTGTIYRNDSSPMSIGDSIKPTYTIVWYMVGTINGEQINPDDNYRFLSQSECQDYIAEGVSGGFVQESDLTCQRQTIQENGFHYYTTSQSEIQNNSPYYFKHDVVNDIITSSYACFVDDIEHCLKGGSSEYFSNNTLIIQGLENLFAVDSGRCSYDNSTSDCKKYPNTGLKEITAKSDGSVKISYISESCNDVPNNCSCIPGEKNTQ